jgi:hypothetical protein
LLLAEDQNVQIEGILGREIDWLQTSISRDEVHQLLTGVRGVNGRNSEESEQGMSD